MLETIREFAVEALPAQAGCREIECAARGHYRGSRSRLSRVRGGEKRSGGSTDWTSEHDNLRADSTGRGHRREPARVAARRSAVAVLGHEESPGGGRAPPGERDRE